MADSTYDPSYTISLCFRANFFAPLPPMPHLFAQHEKRKYFCKFLQI